MNAGAGPRLTDAQRLDWLRLIRSENVGPRTFRELVNRFGGAAAALAALPELSRRGGGTRAPRILPAAEAAAELEAIARAGARLVAVGEDGYPPRLRHIADPPPLVTVKGRTELFARPAVAIVGARNASALGRKMAGQLAADLGRAGQVIVSGLARGIDAAAHAAALETGTVAVVAGGIDIVYPPENESLAEAIGERGVLVSEVAFGTQPTRVHFPRRNRLVSGIAAATIVVDAAARSGSLITARFALEQNREVFAVPGSPLDPMAAGANALIRDGAVLVRDARDVLTALKPMLRRLDSEPEAEFHLTEGEAEPLEPPPGTRAAVAGLLSVSPIEIDDLIREAGAPARDVLGVLLEMELAGRLIRMRGQRVALAP